MSGRHAAAVKTLTAAAEKMQRDAAMLETLVDGVAAGDRDDDPTVWDLCFQGIGSICTTLASVRQLAAEKRATAEWLRFAALYKSGRTGGLHANVEHALAVANAVLGDQT